MAQEFTINSSAIESKINQLLPSQGGSGAGVDFSASTMVIPIVDLTESAEGSSLRADLQTSLSHNSVTSFDVVNTTTTIISTTGYYRVFGSISCDDVETGSTIQMRLFDGSTSKVILNGLTSTLKSTVGMAPTLLFDFNVFISAGDSLICESGAVDLRIAGCTRQIASIDETLTNP